MRDAVRRDLLLAASSLAFTRRLHQRLESQRRLYGDFPRTLEQLRSGGLERVTSGLSRIFEGAHGQDLSRFLRDLPLATAQLAAAEAAARKAATGEAAAAAAVSAASAPAPSADGSPQAKSEVPPPGEEGQSPIGAEAGLAAVPAEAAQPAPAAASEGQTATAAAPSPRLQLRARLLAAAPDLSRAAQAYRRNVGTLRRACAQRRSPGPWRTDREVLEEASFALEFAWKIYSAYAEAWADEPLPADLAQQTEAEVDRFLAWTQLDRYAELAQAERSARRDGLAGADSKPATEAKPAAEPREVAGPGSPAQADAPASQGSAGAGGEVEA